MKTSIGTALSLLFLMASLAVPASSFAGTKAKGKAPIRQGIEEIHCTKKDDGTNCDHVQKCEKKGKHVAVIVHTSENSQTRMCCDAANKGCVETYDSGS